MSFLILKCVFFVVSSMPSLKPFIVCVVEIPFLVVV